jgi:1,4-alpha-glucan branching enzyme
MVSIDFHYITGLAADLFEAAELHGGWDDAGHPSEQWSVQPMESFTADDGCPGFRATVVFPAVASHTYDWGVRLRRNGVWHWGITEELNNPNLSETICRFSLDPNTRGPRQESVRLNWSRHLGAQKVYRPGDAEARISFAVWAPHARDVAVVMADAWNGETGERTLDPAIDPAFCPVPAASVCSCYIADDGSGAHPTWGPFPLQRYADGVWRSDLHDPSLVSFARFLHAPYLFRITRDDGSIRYSTDLYSRCQAGFGTTRPQGAWCGRTLDLDGSVSASVVKDPDVVCREFSEAVYPEQHWLSAADFWPDPASLPPRPRRVQELVIYELHVGALGGGRRAPHEPGTLEDAIDYLDHLAELGVNAVELLPMSESGGGGAGWGYATSHYFAIEYAGGGRDKYKHFIRECHRRGIAVILDVVFNHYHHDAPRAQWQVDSAAPERNIYYWYEGLPDDYPHFDSLVSPERRGHGGYIDNLSSGWAPRYWEPMVRRLFISSLLTLATEFHIDGFRFDQTTSIHAYNRRHADGEPVAAANRFGQKFLREACRALRLVQPKIMLMPTSTTT